MNFKLINLFLVCILWTASGLSQILDDTLIGMSNHKLFKINQNTAQVAPYLNIANFPGNDPVKLSWVEQHNCYYGIDLSTSNVLFKITANGTYTNLGGITIPGHTIYLMECVAFNPQDNQLYIAASLNGGPSNGDYSSESLIRVNLSNMTGQLIGVFNNQPHTSSEVDADAFDFDEQGNLYYLDGEPPSYNTIYKQNINFNSPAVIVHSGSYFPATDVTIKGQMMYLVVSGQNLLKSFSLQTGILQDVGNLIPQSVFNSQSFRGITWKPSICDQLPVAGFTALNSTIGYPGLTVQFSNSSQQANSFEFYFTPTQIVTTTDVNEIVSATFDTPGIYLVVLTASNGICSDTSMIYVTILQPQEQEPHPIEHTIIPNSFTPNGDGINDEFFLNFPNATSIHVSIFNRWGNQLIEWGQANQKWDGKIHDLPVSEGVYFYSYEVNFKDSTQISGHQFLTLTR